MSFGIKLDQADSAFSKWVRLRDMKCMRCGSLVQLNAKGLPVSHQNSHFQGRGKENTRFDPDNCDTLCGGCHSYLGANPAEHYLWQVSRKGQAKVDEIVLKSNMYCKKDRKSEAIYWRQKLKELK
jgi:hypothetical protein